MAYLKNALREFGGNAMFDRGSGFATFEAGAATQDEKDEEDGFVAIAAITLVSDSCRVVGLYNKGPVTVCGPSRLDAYGAAWSLARAAARLSASSFRCLPST